MKKIYKGNFYCKSFIFSNCSKLLFLSSQFSASKNHFKGTSSLSYHLQSSTFIKFLCNYSFLNEFGKWLLRNAKKDFFGDIFSSSWQRNFLQYVYFAFFCKKLKNYFFSYQFYIISCVCHCVIMCNLLMVLYFVKRDFVVFFS